MIRARDVNDLKKVKIEFLPWDEIGGFVGGIWDGITGESKKKAEKEAAARAAAEAEAQRLKQQQLQIQNEKSNKNIIYAFSAILILSVILMKK
jgi:hypothetical protein